MNIMNCLVSISGTRSIPVKIKDVKSEKIYIYPSISEAGKSLCDNFNVVNNISTGVTAIHNRLSGKTKKPLYKNRFQFEYAEPLDQHPA